MNKKKQLKNVKINHKTVMNLFKINVFRTIHNNYNNSPIVR